MQKHSSTFRSLASVIQLLTPPVEDQSSALTAVDEAISDLTRIRAELLSSVLGDLTQRLEHAVRTIPEGSLPDGLTIPDGCANDAVYLTTDQLSERIGYEARTLRNRLKDTVFLEGTHYIRPFGGRKILWVWAAIERDMRAYLNGKASTSDIAPQEPTRPGDPAQKPEAPAASPAAPDKKPARRGRPKGSVNCRWTHHEDAYIRKHFGKTSRREIASNLGKSTSALSKRIRALGLIKDSSGN